MDMNNLNPTPFNGVPDFDIGDWRATMQFLSRRRIVNQITRILRSNLPFCCQEVLIDLVKIAEEIEEKEFIAASSTCDYLTRISWKMVTINTRCPYNMASAGLLSSVPFVSAPYLRPIGYEKNMSGIWQESMWQGMSSNVVANQMREIHGRQQVVPQQQPQGNLQSSLVQEQQQQRNLLQPSQLQSSQQSDSAPQTGHANGSDEQERLYQKIKDMEETYLPEIQDMHRRISAKLSRYESFPHELTPEKLEKIKSFAKLLERIMHMLTFSTASMVPASEKKLNLWEHKIKDFLNTCRSRRKPVSAMQPNNTTSLQHNLVPGPGSMQHVAPGTYEQDCPAPEPNVAEKPHDATANKANDNSLRSTVVTIVDEASTVVGEDLAAVRKQGLMAFTQTGMSGAFKIRCCLSALVILALVICFIFKLNH